jgi:glycosyltransferase involved in cell wall biosynthesis
LKKKLCIVTASEMTVRAFLTGHLTAMQDEFDVSIVANVQDPDFLDNLAIRARVIPLCIEREISLWRDLAALWQLIALFRRHRFDLIHSVTPKAGLLAMMAGCVAQIPIRVHTFTGQVWATRSGLSRRLLKSMDRLLAACATHVLADSFSQRDFLVRERVLSPSKIAVLADGSISGVDEARFRPDAVARLSIRDRLGIENTDFAFLFIGRLKRDKGVLDLAAAFARVLAGNRHCHLIFAGPDEEGLQSSLLSLCSGFTSNIHFTGYTGEPEQYMAAADVLCLPSYREGFGSVIIEAAAVGIPAVGSRIYGVVDAIEENVTGFLFEVGNIDELAEKMRLMVSDAEMRDKMGAAAQRRARQRFSRERLTTAQLDRYRQLLA